MAKRPDTLRIAIAQLNPTMGDIAGNLELAREARADAARGHADLILGCDLVTSASDRILSAASRMALSI